MKNNVNQTCVTNAWHKQKENKLSWETSYVIDVLSKICFFRDEKYVFLKKKANGYFVPKNGYLLPKMGICCEAKFRR